MCGWLSLVERLTVLSAVMLLVVGPALLIVAAREQEVEVDELTGLGRCCGWIWK